MSDKIKVNEKAKNMFFSVALTESVLAIVLILSIIVLKFFIKKPYSQLKKWCLKNMTTDINISEIVDGAKNEI
ncbi:MAG: hypothetical protein J5659_00590 [Clostridia bacterium]|nr:hypothetical protein [Clostridia bacterium]